MDRSLSALLAETLTSGQLADRLARLQHLTGALSRAVGLEAVTDAVLSIGTGELEAAEAWVCLLDDAHATFEVVANVGAVDETVSRWARFPRRSGLPATDALERDEPVVWESLEDRDRQYPPLQGSVMANDAYVIAPMITEGVEVGALVFGFTGPRGISEADRTFMRAVADQCAQAILRARLHEAEQRAHRWQRFLADASLLLSETLEYEDVLREVVELAVPTLADGCVVHVNQPDGLRPVASAHADSERREQLEALVARQPTVRNPYVLEVAATGKSLLLPTLPDEVVDRFVEDLEHRRMIARLGITSGLVVALKARGLTLGTLTLISTSRERRLDDRQLAVAEDLAARAALAIDNARLYRERSEAASVLQRALLPPQLPAIPGVDLAARHEPGSDMLVGGDFYDVIENPDGSWTVLIGDVCGKDATAAMLTALARYTARAATARDAAPRQVLQAMNEAFIKHEAADQFCTAICARLRPADTGLAVELVVAGHPPPALMGAAGEPELLEPGGQPVGLFDVLDLRTDHLVLAPGDRLVLYTDGVTEARRDDELLGEAGLLAGLAKHRTSTADELVDHLLETVAVYHGAAPRDDVALVALGPTTPTAPTPPGP